MNYELAKKLKDAGFPQQTLLGIWKDATEPMRLEDCPKTWGDTLACPTLEELIEACGDKFSTLEHYNSEYPENHWITKNGRWHADYKINDEDEFECASGKTAAEAVANLWLALNNKS